MDQSGTTARRYELLLGDRADSVFKRITLWLAMVGFGVHLLAWLVVYLGTFEPPANLAPLLASPLLALYTPFSILLVYEVYQLIQAIPRSFSAAMAKQYEVIALIVVRDALAFLATTQTSDPEDSDWFLLLGAKCLAFLTLLAVIVGFNRIDARSRPSTEIGARLDQYVRTKQIISILLFGAFVATVLTALGSWIFATAEGEEIHLHAGIFFSDLFTFLIIADITILLISYRFTSDFGSLARNTGFVLSTVLMRIAIDTPGIGAPILFMMSGVMGLGVLWITGKFTVIDPRKMN